MSADIPGNKRPEQPIPEENLLALLFLGAMAKQGVSVDRAFQMLPRDVAAKIDKQRRELELAAKKSKRGGGGAG